LNHHTNSPDSKNEAPPDLSGDKAYTLSDFDYKLPEELIAQHPADQRTDSRLLHVQPDGSLVDRHFTELTDLLKPHDILIFNDTLVIKARLLGSKDTGGKVEVLVERLLDSERVLAHVKASKTPKPGATLLLGDPNAGRHCMSRFWHAITICLNWRLRPTYLVRSTNTAMCHCHPTSSMPMMRTTRPVIRPFMRATLALLQPQQPDCILMRQCLIR